MAWYVLKGRSPYAPRTRLTDRPRFIMLLEYGPEILAIVRSTPYIYFVTLIYLSRRQNTYTVNGDGSLTLHVSQMPPNPALFAPGPAVLHVVVNGVPSIGKPIMVGGGFIGQQQVENAAPLPPNKG